MNTQPLDFREVRALRGPNLWANYPVLEARVDLGDLKDSPSNSLPGFNERLMAWLPSLIEHRCSVGRRGGFFQRLRDGTYPAHILEHVTLELQTLAGHSAGMGRARETSEDGVYKVIVEYEEEAVARECLATARELLLAAIADRPFDMQAEVKRLRSLVQAVSLGPSTRAIVKAAQARGIPVRRLNAASLVQLGYGARQRRILAAETDSTRAIAEAIAQNKETTRMLLRATGVPVPEGRPVAGAEDAWDAACELGVPVVVKPQDGNQGRGVATNLTTRDQVLAAYEAASREGSSVIVEKFASGNDYRLLVVGGKLIAAARREPAHVVGDGVHSIAELIDRVNADPRRGDDHGTALTKIRMDPIAQRVLADQGYTAESVPPQGQVVLVRRNANLSTGGTAVDVTDSVHLEVAARAIEAASAVGLDVAGIDVIAHDIARPLETQGGIIVEVNAAPGLRMHLQPSAGTPRPVGEAIVATMFPEGENGRIPLVAVTGVNGKTTVTRLVAHLVRGTGQMTGMTCTDGIYLNDRRIERGDCSGPRSARSVLLNPMVEAAVFETARGGILREGLGFDRCDVAVVTNIGEGDHLGLADVENLETLAKVKRCIVDVVLPSGSAVLNAEDPLVAAMAEKCPGQVVLFSPDKQHPEIVRHRGEGRRAVTVDENVVLLADGPREEPLISLDRVPLARGGRVRFEVENVLAAVGAAWSLGLPLELIRERLTSFACDFEHIPGRFNRFSIDGATVIVDYGHNVSALTAVIEAIRSVPAEHRTAVYSTAGDRRDCDIVGQGRLLGDAFDHVILYEDHYRRGRQEGEIIGLFRQGLAQAKRTKRIDDVQGAIKAVDAGLATLAPGHVLLIQADTIDETVEHLRHYLANCSREGKGWFGDVDGLVRMPEDGQPLAPATLSDTTIASPPPAVPSC